MRRPWPSATALSNLQVVGVTAISAQPTTLPPFLDAFDQLSRWSITLPSIQIKHLTWCGLVQYRDEQPPLAGDYIKAVCE
jgi:diaminopimelate decarboxylase